MLPWIESYRDGWPPSNRRDCTARNGWRYGSGNLDRVCDLPAVTIYAVRVGDEPAFVAHVFRGDHEKPRRVWVCLRGSVPPIPDGWVGCWSSKDEDLPSGMVQDFVRRLSEKVREGGAVGPFGSFLRDHYFFDGWESWGAGVPAVLAHLQPTVAIESSQTQCGIDEFRFD